jgi:hypothetical protein
MALPTKERTFGAVVVRQDPTGDTHENHRRLMYALKGAFLTAGWTVERSCDASSVAASDLWDAWSKVTWNVSSQPRSWIVFRPPAALHNTMRLLVSCECQYTSNSEAYRSIYVSWSVDAAGYTGGSTTVKPTAVGEIVIRDGVRDNSTGRWLANTNTNVTLSFNLAYATDGSGIRCFLNSASASPSYASFFVLDTGHNMLTPTSDWDATYPVVGLWVYQPTAAYVNRVVVNPVARLNGTAVAAFFATLAYGAADSTPFTHGERQSVANDNGGLGWPMTEIVLVSNTLTRRGAFGRIKDLFFGDIYVSHGTTYPASGDREFAQFGHIVTAWNGTPGVPGTAVDIC